jgi:hypothetical protein
VFPCGAPSLRLARCRGTPAKNAVFAGATNAGACVHTGATTLRNLAPQISRGLTPAHFRGGTGADLWPAALDWHILGPGAERGLAPVVRYRTGAYSRMRPRSRKPAAA